MNWFAAIVRSKKEDEVSAEAAYLGLESYCPIVQRYRRVPKHRRATVASSRELIQEILFPGYVFVRAEQESQISALLQHRYVFAFVSFANRLCHVREKDLEELRQRIRAGFYRDDDGEVPRIEFYDHIGRSVEVVSGALGGTKGILLGIRDRNAIVEGPFGRSIVVSGDNLKLA